MSRAEQGWVQVAAGIGYGAGQGGDTRGTLGRRELPASVRGSAQRSRVWGEVGVGEGQEIGLDMEDGRTIIIMAILGPRNLLGRIHVVL